MKNFKLGFVGLLGVLPTTAWAGGFAINENSAADLGRANTARVTQTQDASAVYGNPALMVKFDRLTISNTASYITGDASFEDQGSVDLTAVSLGGDTDGFFETAIVPALQLVYPISDNLAAGVSINAPYGLASEYEDDWAGRYQGLKSELTTINVNPNIAVKINDRFSVGGGFNIQYAHAELSSAVDFGAICFAQIAPASCGPLGLTPQSADGLLEITGDDWSFGYNFGAAYFPSPNLTIGVHYRSDIDHKIKGDADFTVPEAANILTSSGAFTDSDGNADLPLPATLEAGFMWHITERVALSSNIIHTNWSVLEEIRLDFDNPVQPDSAEELNFKDALRYGVGLDFNVTKDCTLRAGYSFDEGAARAETRTVRIPDNDRDIFAFGAGYTGFDGWRIDAAFNRFSFKETEFSRIGPVGDRVVGIIKADVDVFSFGATKTF